MKTRYFLYGFLFSIVLFCLLGYFGYDYSKSYQDKVLTEEMQKPLDTLSTSILMIKDLNLDKFKPVNSTDNKKTDIVLINFWATWCGPCLFELPEFQKLYKENNNVNFIFASSENEDKVDEFYLKNKDKFDLPFYTFTKEDISKSFYHKYLPTTYLINKRTHLAFRIDGVQHWDSELIRNLIATLSE